jgi:hypothetical protein
MKNTLMLILAAGMPFFSGAQDTASDSVRSVINILFEGMRKSDPILVKSAFSDSAILQSVGKDASGKTVIEKTGVADFAESIFKLKAGDADERVVIETFRIDGPLASVWATYKFYYKGVFSHCGIDSFQLVRINGVWKIQYLIDTRRRKDCGQ